MGWSAVTAPYVLPTPLSSRSGVPSCVVKPFGTSAGVGSRKLSPPTSGTEEISSFV